MELILLTDYPQLGFIGEQVNVRSGYARNYLIPRGIAIEASSRNGRQLQHRRRQIDAKRAKMKGEAETLAERLKNISLEFKLKVGEGGKSFGSIASKDLEAELKKQGFEINKRQIFLPEPVKTVGTFSVEVKLHSEVRQEVDFKVIAEKTAAPKPKKENKKGKREAKETAEGEALSLEAAETEGELEDGRQSETEIAEAVDASQDTESETETKTAE